jgi:sigma54-dependent transcription regulator
MVCHSRRFLSEASAVEDWGQHLPAGLNADCTLCLDEIGEMPLDLQPVLLRVLEEVVIYRLGDTQPRRVAVRLLAMTNRNLRRIQPVDAIVRWNRSAGVS